MVTKFFEEKGIKFSSILKGDPICQAFKVMAFPTNYVIGPDGKVKWGSVGFDEAEVKRQLGIQ